MVTVAEALQVAAGWHQQGRLAEAEQVYADVLRVQPDHVDASHLLGLIRAQQGHPAEGRELIERAVAARPDDPAMQRNLAGVLSQMGEMADAERHYRRAIELDPSYAEGYYSLAQNVRSQADDGLLEAVEERLAALDRSSADEVLLRFAAGKLADDRGAYDRAFAHFAAANAAKDVSYDRAGAEALVAESVRVFDGDLFAAHEGSGVDDPRPVFVIGMPRSGTTLLEQTLARHPAVFGAGERSDVTRMVHALPGQVAGSAGYPACVVDADAQVLEVFARQYLDRVGGLDPSAQRVIDKQPTNFRFAGLISLLFPGARFIHCRRDPVDTALSCFFQNFTNGQEYSFDLDDLVHFHQGYETLMAHWATVLPNPMLDVDYEAMVADPEATARRVVEFCGLDWDDAVLDAEVDGGSVQTASKWQVRQPVYTSSLARWQHYEAHLGPLQALRD
ncbi:MAG: sulfotransferase [Actinomycetota bacterium]